jgi:hypothetical protein
MLVDECRRNRWLSSQSMAAAAIDGCRRNRYASSLFILLTALSF